MILLEIGPRTKIYIEDPSGIREEEVILEKPKLVKESGSGNTEDEAPILKPATQGYSQRDLLASTSDPFLPE